MLFTRVPGSVTVFEDEVDKMFLRSECWLIGALIGCIGPSCAQIVSHPVQQAETTPNSVHSHPSRLQSMHLAGNAREVIDKALRLYGIEVVFSGAVPDGSRPIELNIRDADVATIGEILHAMTHCSFVPINSHLVVVTCAAGRRGTESERQFSQTIRIPNFEAASAKQRSDVEGILNTVFGITKFTIHTTGVSVQGEEEQLSNIRDALTNLFRSPPQILLKVNVYITSRGYSRSVGIQPPQQITVFNLDSEASSLISNNASAVNQLIASGAVSAGDTVGIAEALIAEGYGNNSVLSSPFVTFGGGNSATGVQFGPVSANANLSASTTQQLRSATIRVAKGQIATLKIGQHYPILKTTTTAVGGSSSSTIPSIQYEDLGLSLDATPHVISKRQVEIHIHESLRSLSGTTLNDIPIINNREYVSDLSVPAGMTTVIITSVNRTDASH